MLIIIAAKSLGWVILLFYAITNIKTWLLFVSHIEARHTRPTLFVAAVRASFRAILKHVQPRLSTPHHGRIYLFLDTYTFIGTGSFLFAHVKAGHAIPAFVVCAIWALFGTILNEMPVGFSTPQFAYRRG
jgi:hypothetical protein